MGHTDQVQFALTEIETNLHYKLDPTNCEQLRTAIRFCGMERFRLCLKLVMLQGDFKARGEAHDGNSRHRTLLALMRLTAPHKGPQAHLRNPAAMAAVAMTDQLDADMQAAIARDPD